MRRPRTKVLRDDGEGQVATIVSAVGDDVAIRQYDWGVEHDATDSVVMHRPSEARALAAWLLRWAEWAEEPKR